MNDIITVGDCKYSLFFDSQQAFCKMNLMQQKITNKTVYLKTRRAGPIPTPFLARAFTLLKDNHSGRTGNACSTVKTNYNEGDSPN